jgi:trans-aconitate methyltransferase
MKAPLNPERFDKAVDHYVAARLDYAPELIAWLVRDTGAGGKRVLDLGCGPGFIANAVAPHVSQVLGLDPSANMIDAARAAAAPNARFEIGSSEDLSAVTPPLQLVTIGRAFHWMDRAQTLGALDGLLAEGGAVALLNDRTVDVPMNRWWHAFNALMKSFAVLDDYNQHRASGDWVPHEEVLAGSALSDLRSLSVYKTHAWSEEKLIRHALSRSGTTEALLGDRLPEFKAASRELLSGFGAGPWQSLNQHIALVARRPGEAPLD